MPHENDELKKILDEKDEDLQESTSPVAQYNLGRDYEEEDEIAHAIQWYQKAANQDFAPAQHRLGLIYLGEEGEVVPDSKVAVQLLQKAATQNYAPAETALGQMHEMGNYLQQDYDAAIALYRKAADHKDSEAFSKLKQLYLKDAKNPCLNDSQKSILAYHLLVLNQGKNLSKKLRKQLSKKLNDFAEKKPQEFSMLVLEENNPKNAEKLKELLKPSIYERIKHSLEEITGVVPLPDVLQTIVMEYANPLEKPKMKSYVHTTIWSVPTAGTQIEPGKPKQSHKRKP